MEKLRDFITSLWFKFIEWRYPTPVIKDSPQPKKDYIKLWALSIQAFEGWYPGSNAYRCNNPGNIRCRVVMNHLAIGIAPKGFCIFPDYATGLSALMELLRNACEGKSKIHSPSENLLDFMSIYSPESDGNPTKRYAQFVADKLGVSVDTEIRTLI